MGVPVPSERDSFRALLFFGSLLFGAPGFLIGLTVGYVLWA